ncbi:UNVERIFIED_CONTAM: dockerin type I repeat protein [Acetivibrio alkalicellulosi]
MFKRMIICGLVLALVCSTLLATTVFGEGDYSFNQEITYNIYGDLNGDGIIDSTDYILLKRYVLSIITDFSPEQKIIADLNGDGVVNSIDCVLLKRYILDIINKFPVEEMNEDIINIPEGEVENIVLAQYVTYYPPNNIQKTVTGEEDIRTIYEMIQGIKVLRKTNETVSGAGCFYVTINFEDGTEYTIAYDIHLIKDSDRYKIEFTKGNPQDIFDELDYPIEDINNEDPYSDIINVPEGEIENIVLAQYVTYYPPNNIQKTVTGEEDIRTIYEMVQGIKVLGKANEALVGAGLFYVTINFEDGTEYTIAYDIHLVKDSDRYKIEFTKGNPKDIFDELDYPIENI